MVQPIYTAPTLEAAEQALGAFENSNPGKSYPARLR